MIYFISNIHFSNERIMKLCHRPFKNIDKIKSYFNNKLAFNVSADVNLFMSLTLPELMERKEKCDI